MGRDSEMEKDSESEEEIECDLSNMEITDELRQYFAQTEAHRKELRKFRPCLYYILSISGCSIEYVLNSTFGCCNMIHRSNGTGRK